MSKLKTRKSAIKRIKLKKNILMRKKAFKSHLMKSKNAKRIRNLSKQIQIHPADKKIFLLMGPYL